MMIYRKTSHLTGWSMEHQRVHYEVEGEDPEAVSFKEKLQELRTA